MELVVFALVAILIVAAAVGRVDWFQAAIGVVLLLVLWHLLVGTIPAWRD